ncbi:hypothetical protein M9H77_33414 [Catharanthus roseus]|uniref:Uncharacterized protein n=1 Tax=Catharanthus roseus TaxID=4058 RepID=A0ACB9ZJ87_CATRO|nr:hypothetical protein M9H77_33414 [Catharanthus roseus]
MATIDEDSSSSEKPNASSSLQQFEGGNDVYSAQKLKTLGEETAVPWINYAVQQALLAQRTIESATENAIASTKSRLESIRTTSSAHFSQTLDYLQDAKSEYSAYDEIVFAKIKEGIHLAAANPLITTASIVGVGLLGLKRPRRFLYYSTMRFFMNEEALLSRADAKVKKLQETFQRLKTESEKLEKTALQAQEEMTRGRTKLRQAGKQIQSVISSAYKIERQAQGLKDVLRELPSREASRFRTQVSKVASEAKKERSVLTKEVTKISNHGISI